MHAVGRNAKNRGFALGVVADHRNSGEPLQCCLLDGCGSMKIVDWSKPKELITFLDPEYS